ncbi:efflux RND transporter periplasmic adaptor subunit [Deferrisoma palaeochoriense]
MNRSAWMASLTVLALLAGGCAREAATAPTAEAARPVKTAVVSAGSPVESRSFPGVVEAATETRLAFRVGGPVVALEVGMGERVARGQVLARIDPRDYRVRVRALEAALAEARAQAKALREGARAEDVAALRAERTAAASRLEEARTNWERYRRLLAEGVVAQAAVDRARTAYDAARAALEALDRNLEKATSGGRPEDLEAMDARIDRLEAELAAARNALADTELRAPFDGVVRDTLVERHETVAPGQPVVSLFQDGRPEITVRVPEAIAAHPERIAGVVCTVEALPGRRFEAEVKEVGRGTGAANQGYPLTVAVRIPKGVVLQPGMAASVTLALRNPSAEGAVRVPLAAVAADPQGRSRVFRFDPSTSTAVPVPVRTGAVHGGEVEILEGLTPGDEIVTAGARFLRPGQPVRRLGR